MFINKLLLRTAAIRPLPQSAPPIALMSNLGLTPKPQLFNVDVRIFMRRQSYQSRHWEASFVSTKTGRR